MTESETHTEVKKVIDISDKAMWGTAVYDFLKKHAFKSVVNIDLSTNHINHESAQYLSDLIKMPSQLQYLTIADTRMTQESTNLIFCAIGESCLLEFYADDNIFPTAQCKVLAESLSKDPSLEVLSLCGCDISSEGGSEIANALPSNKHLKHLRLESNSLYDIGAIKLSENLGKSSLISLNIADNEIWTDGTNALIVCLKDNPKFESLDISYNALDLNVFCTEIEKTNISELAVSGCKVHEQLFPTFLGKISNIKRLKTLILDGFSFQTLPISWPRIKDNLFQTRSYFDDLLLAIQQSPTLTDLRVGHLEMEQIFGIKRLLDDSMPHSMILSLHDFGRTDNCWIVHLPELRFESPTTTFRWNSPVHLDNCGFIGQIVNNTTFNGDKLIDAIDLHSLKLEDDVFIEILESIQKDKLRRLDCSDNNLGDASLDAVRVFLKDVVIDELDFSENASSDLGCETFVKNLMSDKKIKIPQKLNLCFKSTDLSELSAHSAPNQIAELLKTDAEIASLHLGGPVTVADALTIVDAISQNSHIHELEFQSDHIKNYMGPDPEINVDVQQQFLVLASVLHSVLTDENSMCNLKNFVFPLLTEVFIYTENICEKWQEVEDKLAQNSKEK